MTELAPAAAISTQSQELAAAVRRQSRRSTLAALGSSLATFGLTLVTVLILWQGMIWVFGLSPFVAKGPKDVYDYLFTVPNAAANREELFTLLGETMVDAFIGFIFGLALATIVAIVFQLSKGVEAALMPIALLLRSVPLIAFAPVIIMIFGREWATIAVMGGIVVLFPALVNIAFGLKSASPQMLDLVSVYGGKPLTSLRKVALPSSLPAFFAAVRISVPGAITGALLAEWLATGGGIGGAINGYITSAKFGAVWASVVAVTAVSLILYNVVQIIEDTVLARKGMHPEKRV
jgi:ABC-type nitrate/sulfonate/bicarbonate transport system permease component